VQQKVSGWNVLEGEPTARIGHSLARAGLFDVTKCHRGFGDGLTA
jgi:hypothetical protein